MIISNLEVKRQKKKLEQKAQALGKKVLYSKY
jgi:hypothetical protein